MTLATLAKKVFRQLRMLVLVALVLVAAYVSMGRQFMPGIANYSDFVEQQINAITGLPVSVDAIAGDFDGFNPEVRVSGLSLLVGTGISGVRDPDIADAADSALFFDSATVALDVPRSIWQRRWVLDEFTIDSLELTVVQDDSGEWRLGSMVNSGGATTSLEQLFQAFQRVSRLDLNNVTINVENRLGDSYRFTNGSATIQNLGQRHLFHVDVTHDGSDQQIQASLEVQGNQLASLDGLLHIRLPDGDYSNILRSQSIGEASISELLGAADLWLQWRQGELLESVASLDLEAVTLLLPENNSLTLEAIAGDARLRRRPGEDGSFEQSAWSLSLDQVTMTHNDHFWRPFSLHSEWQPQENLSLRIDAINLSLLAATALESGFLGDDARAQLLAYAPGGSVRNLVLNAPLGEADQIQQTLQLRGNLDNVELGSVRGSPNMWGIDGFFELQFDPMANFLSGSAELESDNFSINIPNVFTRVWDYDYVNGRIDFEVDMSNGQTVILDSGVMVAESDAVDGHVQFRSMVKRPNEGERDAELDLFVGVSRFDASQKSLYLPDGPQVQPNLRNSMEFLERAIIDGSITSAGVMFRGKTLPGSGPATKTFQSFYVLENGELEFSDQWPRLQQLSAAVTTSDNDIDIEVLSGGSLELEMGAAVGLIRRNEANETWLTINGQAAGATNAGLDYLQAAPLNEALKSTFADWQAEGDFSAGIEVLVPLNIPGRQPDIRLEMLLERNQLQIQNLDLAVTELTGPVIFDTRTGLEESTLQGEAFAFPVSIDLSSEFENDALAAIAVQVSGSTTPAEMIAWPRQSAFVRDLFRQAEGRFDYQARLLVDQTGDAEAGTVLQINSDLTRLGFDLPMPFDKSPDLARALQVNLDFMAARQRITGSFGDNLRFQLDLQDDQMQDGLVYLGDSPGQFELLAENETDGLAIVGELPGFELEQWTAFLTSLGGDQQGLDNFSNSIAFADIEARAFTLYGQELPAVAFRIEPDSQRQAWFARLTGSALAGEVLIPYRPQLPLNIDLEYLRLPGDPEAEAEAAAALARQAETATGEVEPGQEAQEEEERIDPLLGIDPRELPPMRFATDEFSIGARPFGQWQFALRPTVEGAEFEDLQFDFRGLRLGKDELPESVEQLTPHFSWYYDGQQHRSELTGVLRANDIGEVLLANGYAASLVSSDAIFVSELSWPGSPAFFSGESLSGRLEMLVEDGRFLQESGGAGALKLVSIINFSAIMRRLRFSDDLLRRGLAFDEITGQLQLQDGLVDIQDQLVISGPSSLYQITGEISLAEETINGEMYVTLPVSDNIPWLGLLTANLPLAVGAYLFDQIFGDQVDSLTSAVYTLQGPWEGLQPEFKQAFGSPEESGSEQGAAAGSPVPEAVQ
jgi:uncharacterized protein (TIGR02099 family)